MLPRLPSTRRRHLQAAPLYRARAIYAYAAANDEELSIGEDDALLVFEQDDDWLLVKLVESPDGRVGYVPAAYVQEEAGTAGEEGFNGDAVDEVRFPVSLPGLAPHDRRAQRRRP